MLDGISGAAVNGVGVIGLLAGLFWMLARGNLVTRREAQDLKDDRDRWRVVAEVAVAQNNKLVDKSDLTLDILRSIDRRSEGVDRRAQSDDRRRELDDRRREHDQRRGGDADR